MPILEKYLKSSFSALGHHGIKCDTPLKSFGHIESESESEDFDDDIEDFGDDIEDFGDDIEDFGKNSKSS